MRKRTVKILTGIAVVLVLLGLIYSVAVGISAARLRTAYAALRKDGRPMEPEDVIPPEVPETENAAPLFKSAALLLKAQPAPEKDLLTYLGDLSGAFTGGSVAPDKVVEIKRLLEQDAVIRALWIVEQGTLRDSCHFDTDYEAGIYALLPHLRDFRHFGRILGAKALLDARDGRSDSAWGAIRTQLRLADALRTDPPLVSQLLRAAIVRISCGTIRQLAEIEPPDGQQSAEIGRLLKSFEDVQPLVNAIDGERLLFGEWAFNLPMRELLRQHDFVDDGWTILGACFKPVRLAYHRSYLRIMHQAAEFMEQPHSPDQVRAVNEMIEKKSRGLARSLAPAMARVKVIHNSMLAEIRITRTGLDLLQTKQAAGAFPQTLTQFEPAQVEDPFSGASLVYRSGAEDFLLYSVGQDREDNDGRPKQKDDESHWDIVWQFPSPEKTSTLPPATTESLPPGELGLGGEHIERLVLHCEDGPDKTFERPGKSVTLPVGRYRLDEVSLEGGFTHHAPEPMFFDPTDPEWDDATSIVVAAAKPAKLNVGGPIRHRLKVHKDTGYLSLRYQRVGVGGEEYLAPGGGIPPTFAVYRGDKKVGSGQFEPTGGGTCTQSWRVPLTVWGNLRIVPAADIGKHGPSEGPAVSFHWKWYYGPVRFTMWLLVGLAVVLVKANRDVRTLAILAPLLAVIVLWALVCAILPADSGSETVFSLVVYSVTAGITLLWLLVHKLDSLSPVVAFLAALAIMVVVAVIGIVSFDLSFDGDAQLAILMLCLLEVGMLFGFLRAARACRRSYSLRRFVTRVGSWTFLCSVGLMFVFWLFGFLLGHGTDLGDVFECLLAGGFVGMLIFMVNIPFIVLAFHNSFFGERLHACLRLEPAQ
jgi:hypothetical protein